MQPPKSIRRTRGLVPASGLLRGQIKAASESRGFSDSRVLTHWAEIVGEEIARMARPVKISYTKDGFGASLTLLTIGAAAPMLEMQKPKIKERVNACFGYSAISRIVITQTAPLWCHQRLIRRLCAKPPRRRPRCMTKPCAMHLKRWGKIS
jgi:hypothetical protein